MDLKPIPGEVTTVTVGFDENADEVAHQLATQWGVDTVIGADASAHVSLLRATVREELALALEHRGTPRAEMAARVDAMLDAVGLTELAERDPARLSGGQTRRLVCAAVAIARPKVLLVVEPYAGLDPNSRAQVESLLHGLRETAVVLVQADTRSIPPDLTPVAPGDGFTLGPLSATRGMQRRRWWQLTAPEHAEFAVGPVTIPVRHGGVTWLRGGNGSGKTTLLRAAAGLDGHEPAHSSLGMALQSPMDQAITPTLAQLVGDAALTAELGLPPDAHPLDASASQLRVAQVAATVAQGCEVMVFDEPDTLADATGRTALHSMLHRVLSAGSALIITCHDPAFVAEITAYATVRECSISTIN